ncbi:MAG: hypothetical protein ABR592_13160 [Nitriliruptorales bacterium]
MTISLLLSRADLVHLTREFLAEPPDDLTGTKLIIRPQRVLTTSRVLRASSGREFDP